MVSMETSMQMNTGKMKIMTSETALDALKDAAIDKAQEMAGNAIDD